MPALPWIARRSPAATVEYTVMASRLPLRRHRFVPGFLRDTLRIRHQLADAPGLIGYGLKADLLAKTFWTFSVWEDQGSLDAFARSDPHRSVIRRLAPRMGPSRFATFTVRGDALPGTWPERIEQVASGPGGGPSSMRTP